MRLDEYVHRLRRAVDFPRTLVVAILGFLGRSVGIIVINICPGVLGRAPTPHSYSLKEALCSELRYRATEPFAAPPASHPAAHPRQTHAAPQPEASHDPISLKHFVLFLVDDR